MKNSIVIFMGLILSFSVLAQHNHHSQMNKDNPVFEDKTLGDIYGHYIHLKNALVASEYDEAKKGATALATALDSYKSGEKAYSIANKVRTVTTLKDQRKLFSALSDEITVLVKNGKMTKGNVYLEFCPMANGNTGGAWLSSEKDIKNPYFGDKMLKCGMVKETIN
ncbi:DUF3347 domain-containing protein [Flexithrix dorotheae]|uniref:DUF3347 domain-containing protein n=1 Tax=Flexithrix dorotheae TaxID=70993 RepID=UPI000475BDDD|nr:DUF3347 domain-containing protein [Flexithrix dorotheae]